MHQAKNGHQAENGHQARRQSFYFILKKWTSLGLVWNSHIVGV
jgi:hypothetical protein